MKDNVISNVKKALERWPWVWLIVVMPLLSLAMHYRVFSLDLMSTHVWRQTQTQSTIINFYEEDFNIFHPRRNDRGSGSGIFRMEFPLMQWLYAGVHKVFDSRDIAITRMLCFATGMFAVWGMYVLLRLLFGLVLPALAGAWAFSFSPSFYYYTLNPMPDNFALCCGIWGLVAYELWRHKNRHWGWWTLSALFLSMATLSKLPFILFFAIPFVDLLLYAKAEGAWRKGFVGGSIMATALLMPAWWYLTVIPEWHGNGIVKGILDSQVSFLKLLDYVQHNLFSTLPELLLNFAAVPLFIYGLYVIIYKKILFKTSVLPFAVCVALLCLYTLFEINMIAKIHDYYFFPFLPFLFIVVTFGLIQWQKFGSPALRWSVFLMLAIMPFTAWLRMQGRWDPGFPHCNIDLIQYKKELQNAVPKNALCVVGDDVSHFIYFYHLDKKGWGFHHGQLAPERLSLVISEGARYLYSDNRTVDTNPLIRPFLDSLILEKGSFRVYSLKKTKS